MIVAVTGASGLVGSAVVAKLSELGIRSRSLVRSESATGLLNTNDPNTEVVEADVLDFAGLQKALEGADAVIHAAGYVSFNPRNRQKVHDINVGGTANVVNACLSLRIPKLVHVSSVAALGKQRGVKVLNESAKWVAEGMSSDYADSKYLAELEVYRGMEEGLNVSLVNPSVVLAAGDGQRSSSQLFSYVWKERAFYANFILNYVDVRDVSGIIVKLLSKEFNGERFIANGGNVELGDAFKMIAKRFNKKAPSVAIPGSLVKIAATFEKWRSILGGSEPLVTKQTATFLKERIVFENEKAKKVLGIEFQSLENTLDWCCETFKLTNTNK